MRLLESGPDFFDRYLLTSVRVHDELVLYFVQQQNPLIQFFASVLRDFIVHLNKDGMVRNVTNSPALESALAVLPEDERTLPRIIGKAPFTEIGERERKALAYMQSLRSSRTGPWSTIVDDSFGDMSGWIVDSAYRDCWRINGGLNFMTPGRIGFIFRKEVLDMTDLDFAVTIQATQEELSRIGLLFNYARPSPWAIEGYSLGFRVFQGKILLLLKKNSQPSYYRLLSASPGPEFLLRIEKTGGCFDVFVNGITTASFEEAAPLLNGVSAFGLVCNGSTRFTRFRIETRHSKFDPSRIYQPVRVKVPGVSDQVYEVHLHEAEDWQAGGPGIGKALLFKEVTALVKAEADRDALDQAYLSLKTRNYHGFVGGNAAVISLLDTAEKVADSKASILILGPTGSGKEVLARAIHERSGRRAAPFVKVDCSAIPAGLLESELFGHERGAFTGAVDRHIGKFETANRGTLFLDEVGNLDGSTQAKLLAFLENQVVNRIGAETPVPVDVRIVLATNSDLKEMVRKGTFREDLYYRMNVVTLKLPALKNRVDDIPLLADYFLGEINRNHKLKITGISRPVMDFLLTHPWPGNARELYNTLLNLSVQKKEGEITALPDPGFGPAVRARERRFIPARIREEHILGLLQTQPFFSAQDCRRVLPVSIKTIRRDLQQLVRCKQLRMEGKGPSVRYFPGP